MRIVFLGTSHGVPEANRKFSCAMVEIGENRYFIDMGTLAIEQMNTKNIPVESVKAVFITHMHTDHTNGLIPFIDLCSWYYKNATPIFLLPEPVGDNVSRLSAWLECNGTTLRDFDFRPVNEGVIYEDESIKVTAFQTKHTAASYAFLLEAESKRVLFSGDLYGPQIDFPVSVFEKPIDLAICECAHFPATAYLPIFENEKNLKSLCINHYIGTSVPGIWELKKSLKDITVLLANDGMEINI